MLTKNINCKLLFLLKIQKTNQNYSAIIHLLIALVINIIVVIASNEAIIFYTVL